MALAKDVRGFRPCACGCRLPILSNFEESEFRMGHRTDDWILAMELLAKAGISFAEEWNEKFKLETEIREDPRA
jgi:hypothetical protein